MNKLHFKGDHRKFVPNRIVGPDMWGAWYLPISAHYFGDTTTIFYKPVPPDQLPPQAALLSKQVVAKQQRGKVAQWPGGSEPSTNTRLPNSSAESPILRGSTVSRRKAARGGKGLTRSQRELLKRFRNLESK